MICRADAACRAYEGTGNRITNPHGQPCLPPGQSIHDTSRTDHPGVNVERVSDPEADEVPRTPLPPGRLDGLQIIVRQLGS